MICSDPMVTMTTPVKVLIADDHTLFRSGLEVLLNTVEGIDLLGTAADGEETITLSTTLQPDVVLLDITMPKLNGIETSRALKQQLTGIKILVLTMHDQEEYLFQMIRAGADGYLLKTAGIEELVNAIYEVARGQSFFSAPVFELMAHRYIQDAQQVERPPRSSQAMLAQLTNREQEVLILITQGFTNPEIATKLFISPRTVDTHRTNLMQKLGIKNTAGLVRFAIEQGLSHD